MRSWIPLMVLGLVLALGASSADAQLVARTVYYSAPTATYVQPLPTVVYRPVVPTTVVTTAMPATYSVRQPVYVTQPTIPVTVLTPAPVVTTRYRPILGGTVSRTWYP